MQTTCQCFFERRSLLKSIDEGTFSGTISLSAVRIPFAAEVHPTAFPPSCQISKYDEDGQSSSNDEDGQLLSTDDDETRLAKRPTDRDAWILRFENYEFVGDFEESERITLYEEKKREQTRSHLIAFKQYPDANRFPSYKQIENAVYREIDCLIQLDHPCIVPLVGFCPSTSTRGVIVATVYMSGGSLSDILNSNPGPTWWNDTGKAIAVMELVSGMKFTHNSNIVHRDLKRANLVFDSDHHLYICDFGMSREMFPDSDGTGSIGTPAYMAPEMFDNEPYSNKVDVYAFGLILYEIITNRPVFSPTLSPYQIMKNVCIDEFRPDIPVEVLPWVRELIERCWHQDDDQRPTFSEIETLSYDHVFQICPETDPRLLHVRFQTLADQINSRKLALSPPN
jgi:serine/threonine protein kinase